MKKNDLSSEMNEKNLKRIGIAPSMIEGGSTTIRRISEQRKRLNSIKRETNKKEAFIKLFKAAEWADGLKTEEEDSLEKEWSREFDLMRHILSESNNERDWKEDMNVICEAINYAVFGDFEFAEIKASKLGISEKEEWKRVVDYWKRNS